MKVHLQYMHDYLQKQPFKARIQLHYSSSNNSTEIKHRPSISWQHTAVTLMAMKHDDAVEFCHVKSTSILKCEQMLTGHFCFYSSLPRFDTYPNKTVNNS